MPGCAVIPRKEYSPPRGHSRPRLLVLTICCLCTLSRCRDYTLLHLEKLVGEHWRAIIQQPFSELCNIIFSNVLHLRLPSKAVRFHDKLGIVRSLKALLLLAALTCVGHRLYVWSLCGSGGRQCRIGPISIARLKGRTCGLAMACQTCSSFANTSCISDRPVSFHPPPSKSCA